MAMLVMASFLQRQHIFLYGSVTRLRQLHFRVATAWHWLQRQRMPRFSSPANGSIMAAAYAGNTAAAAARLSALA